MSFVKSAVILTTVSLSCSALGSALESLTKDNRATSVEEFLKTLPAPLKARPVFMYESRSLQEGTRQAPRILLSEPNGGLVLSFTGHGVGERSEMIETMEYDVSQSNFVFHEVTFSSAGVKVSAPNPPACMTCHRGGKPIWESYDRWPGAYGSEDDRLTSAEFAPFVKFLKSAPTTPRYKELDLRHFDKVIPEASYTGRLPLEPNITFTHTLSHNNFHRVARLMTETPGYDRYKYVTAAILACDAPMNFVPESERALLNYYNAEDLAQARLLKSTVSEDYAYQRTHALRSVFESRGIDTSDWFMNFKGGLTNTFLTGMPWTDELLAALMLRDAELKQFIVPGTIDQIDCNRLSDRSIEVLGSSMVPSTHLTFAMDEQAPKRIWQRACASCHEVNSPAQAPQFNYNEGMQLPSFKERIESGEMPMDQKLTPQEIHHLINGL